MNLSGECEKYARVTLAWLQSPVAIGDVRLRESAGPPAACLLSWDLPYRRSFLLYRQSAQLQTGNYLTIHIQLARPMEQRPGCPDPYARLGFSWKGISQLQKGIPIEY